MKSDLFNREGSREELIRRNCANFQAFTFGGVLITGFILVIGLVLHSYIAFVREYCFFFAYMSFLYLLACRCSRRQTRFILPIHYAALTPIYICAILMGTFLDTQRPAITVMVLLSGLTLFLIDKPIHIGLYLSGVGITFAVCSYLAKPPEVFTTDMINLLVYGCIAAGINYYTLRERLENVNNFMLVREKSEHDTMTGLLNRTAGEALVREQLAAGVGGAFIILDIDNFKSINDTFGHQIGDEVIRGVGQALQSQFRPSDVVWRLGGDEYAVFAVGLMDRNLCIEKFERLRQKLAELATTNPECHGVSYSVGCTLYRGGGAGFEALYRSTDHCLYTAKRSHKGGCVFCEK